MRIVFFTLLFFSLPTFAITPEEVVASSLNHFPKVIQSIKQLEIEENKTMEKRGAFDGSIQGKMSARTEGYYEGDYYELKAEKPIPYFNTKIFGGKRQGFDDFPVYEAEYETLNEGELFAGFSVSLLRNSLIDMNRFNLYYQQENRTQAKIDVKDVKINVQTMALKAYWTWFVKGQQLSVHQGILKLAAERMGNFKKRVKLGDLPAIYLTENNQYLLARKAKVIETSLEFQKASFYLSLFYRNEKGVPKVPDLEDLPSLEKIDLSASGITNDLYKRAVENNLDLKKLRSQEKQAELEVRMGNNDLIPELDLSYEWRQDQGVGPERLRPEENKVLLSLEIPFQFRKGLGQKRAAKAKIEQIKTKKNWQIDQLNTKVASLKTEIEAYSSIYQTTKQQVEMADKLADAERRKFSQGASDLILVNIREINYAEAQVKNLMSLLKYEFASADLKKQLVEFIPLQ